MHDINKRRLARHQIIRRRRLNRNPMPMYMSRSFAVLVALSVVAVAQYAMVQYLIHFVI
jgi:hypothetical protein